MNAQMAEVRRCLANARRREAEALEFAYGGGAHWATTNPAEWVAWKAALAAEWAAWTAVAAAEVAS